METYARDERSKQRKNNKHFNPSTTRGHQVLIRGAKLANLYYPS